MTMNDTKHDRVYLTESDIQKAFKNRKKYKIKSGTSTRSHVNKNKHKNDNRFREHFSQNLSSQKTRNGVSEHQDFKIFWGSMPTNPASGSPLQCSSNSSVIKNHDFCVNMILPSIAYYSLRSTPLNEKIAKKTVNI